MTTSGNYSRAGSATIDSRIWKWLWLILIIMVVITYLLVNLRFTRVQSASIDLYLARPLAWTSLAILAYLGLRFGLPDQRQVRSRLTGIGLLVGLFQVGLWLIAGLVSGFGHSPYAHDPLAVLGNVFYVVTMLVGIELSRTYLVRVFDMGSRTLAVVTPSLFFTMISVPIARYTTIVGGPSMLTFVGESFLPGIAENFLASTLALLGGPAAAIVYRGTLEAFKWLSPVLPNLHWIVIAFIGTMAPAFGLLVVHSTHAKTNAEEHTTYTQGGQLSTSWILTAGVAVALLWFNTGFLGIQPTVVSGVSMKPTLVAGDLVLTRNVPAEEIAVGDVIRFQQEGTYIMHRVVGIEKGAGEIHFITQGDANNIVDPPVSVENLDGKVILVIPKVGWVAIGLRRLLSWIG